MWNSPFLHRGNDRNFSGKKGNILKKKQIRKEAWKADGKRFVPRISQRWHDDDDDGRIESPSSQQLWVLPKSAVRKVFSDHKQFNKQKIKSAFFSVPNNIIICKAAITALREILSMLGSLYFYAHSFQQHPQGHTAKPNKSLTSLTTSAHSPPLFFLNFLIAAPRLFYSGVECCFAKNNISTTRQSSTLM